MKDFPMQQTIGVAIVGAGYMASEHARAFAAIPAVRIVGVCGRRPDRAEALAAQHCAPVFDDIGRMAAETHAAIVVVAVNELSMAAVCSEVFKHSWLVFLEKPVGVDWPQAREIADQAARAGARAYVALNRRSYASTRQALATLAEGQGPRLVSVLDQQDMASAAAGGQPAEVVRNYMFANSIHLVDYFNCFCRGRVREIVCPVPWSPEVPGHVVAVLRYDSGDSGVYQAVWNGPGPWSCTVTNDTVRVELRPLERLGIQRRGERRLTEVAPDPIDSEFKPGLMWQARQVLEAHAGRPHTLASIGDALDSMALVADIYGMRGDG